MTSPSPHSRLARVAGPVLLTAIGMIGAAIAVWLNMPLPFMLGPLFAVGAVVILFSGRSPVPLTFPQNIRAAFVAVIGVMIGSAFDPSILENLAAFIPSFLMVVVFVIVAFTMNFAIYRHLGKYDFETAYWSSMPGGLVESILMAEERGGDVRLVTAQHFFRIALVVSCLPFLFSIWAGEPVGSAAGMQLSGTTASTVEDWAILGIAGALGYFLGKAIRLPAYTVVGPLMLSAVAHLTGLTNAGLPVWLIATAQLVIGIGLGARFSGLTGGMIKRVFWLGATSVITMHVIAFLVAAALSAIIPYDIPVLILCFAAGGLIEMGLIAVSLQASPVFVTIHHVVRISVTVVFATTLFRKIAVRV